MMASRIPWTLLACSPAADAAFVRDDRGDVWKVLPSGSRLVSESQAVDAVRLADFLALDEEFPSAAEVQVRLDDIARQWRGAGPNLDEFVKSYDVPAIERVLRAALRQASSDDVRIVTLARKLLELCPNARDEQVFHRLLDLAQLTASPPTASVLTFPSRADTEHPELRSRVAQDLVA